MRHLLGLVLATLVLAGCGVPLQTAPQPIPEDAIPAPIPTPTVTEEPIEPEPQPEPVLEEVRLWFVREDGLVAVETQVAVPVTPEGLVQSLAVGPTPQESGTGLRTVARDPLTGLSLVTIPTPAGDVQGGTIEVALGRAFTALPPTEQVLLLGQVVLTLTGNGWQGVSFVDEAGSPVAVPLPDGRLLDVPATAAAYSSLIVEL